MEGKYRFRIGSRALLGKNLGTSIPGERHALYTVGIGHRCLLLDDDIFEYGERGWARHKNVGMDPNYDWDRVTIYEHIYIFEGRTNVSPDELSSLIEESGLWTGNKYNFAFHNCCSFVEWCISQIDGHKCLIY